METNKKYFNRLAGGAVLLAGAMAFAACSSDEDFADAVNPGAGATGETVKTQFSINVPAGNSANKRLAQDIVQGQNDPVFRGMDEIHMYAFSADPSIATTTTTPAEVYNDMGSILDNELQVGTNAKVYYDMEIPTGVTHFLFYGEADRVNGTTDADNGVLEPTLLDATTDAVSKIRFALKSINTAGNSTATTALLQALNDVAKVAGWSTSTELRDWYVAFTDLKAGSAASIKAALENLKTSIEDASVTIETELKNNILSAIGTAEASIASYTYPRDLGLPDGAAQVTWNDRTPAFEYVTDKKEIGDITFTELTEYVYPASLYYWTNSTIRVSNDTESNNYTTDWGTCLDLYLDGTSVAATTRSVALVNPINYAVGRFDVKAKFANATVKDNVANDVTVMESGGFKLVGLLVGGQKAVQYDFTPISTESEVTIYDQSIGTDVKVTNSDMSKALHTLALETGENSEKYFALELENNTGKSFVGHDGTVPAGGRFYLVGKLTPEPTPESSAGGVTQQTKVFIQDYITTANVTINSLAHAYNCIPDLSTPQLELGLSVDLDWEEGLEYDVVID